MIVSKEKLEIDLKLQLIEEKKKHLEALELVYKYEKVLAEIMNKELTNRCCSLCPHKENCQVLQNLAYEAILDRIVQITKGIVKHKAQ